MCNGASCRDSLNIDTFITQTRHLNCIEAIHKADTDLQIVICAEHGVKKISIGCRHMSFMEETLRQGIAFGQLNMSIGFKCILALDLARK